MKYKTLTCAIAMSVGILTAPLALADLNDGLVAYYPFNGNANDESGNGNHGTVNGATLTEDQFGNPNSAYSFDGVDDYIQFNTPVQDANPPYSVSFGLKYDAVPSVNSYIISNGGQTNYSQGFAFAVVGSSHVYCNQSYPEGAIFFIVGNQDSAVRTTLFAPMSFGQWHHVTGTWDGDRVALYIDGQLAQADVCETPYNFAPQNNMRIGAPSNVLSYYLNGQVDDIRIYNRPLSEDEIQALYAGVPEDGDCQHATYSLKKRTLTVPFVEMPVVDFLTGQPTGEMELWTGSLKQVYGSTNRFLLIHKTVAQITDGSNSSCPATYAVETGTLKIPYIDVPTGIAVGNNKFENNVEVFKATMIWEPMAKSFVVQEVEMVP